MKSYSRCEVKVIDFGSSCFTTDHLSSYVQSRSYRAPEVPVSLTSPTAFFHSLSPSLSGFLFSLCPIVGPCLGHWRALSNDPGHFGTALRPEDRHLVSWLHFT
mgnify:CR=1 FL=1